MKKIISTVLLGIFISISASAQIKPPKTAVIKTPTVQCEACKLKIEEYLNKIDGITLVNVKYKSKQTQVKYLQDRTDIEIIKAAIANVGYDADEIAANPESYKRLPKCCKKPEDGGGMKKQ